jgi:hypothetical protein
MAHGNQYRNADRGNHQDYGDHLHQVGMENGRQIPVSQPPSADEIDIHLGWAEARDETVALDDATSALTVLIAWCCAPQNISAMGGRVCVLQLWLDPTHAKYDSLQQIGDAAGQTRSALSKCLNELRAQLGNRNLLPMKSQAHRSALSRGQIASVSNGDHVSFKRKDRMTATNGNGEKLQQSNAATPSRAKGKVRGVCGKRRAQGVREEVGGLVQPDVRTAATAQETKHFEFGTIYGNTGLNGRNQ